MSDVWFRTACAQFARCSCAPSQQGLSSSKQPATMCVRACNFDDCRIAAFAEQECARHAASPQLTIPPQLQLFTKSSCAQGHDPPATAGRRVSFLSCLVSRARARSCPVRCVRGGVWANGLERASSRARKKQQQQQQHNNDNNTPVNTHTQPTTRDTRSTHTTHTHTHTHTQHLHARGVVVWL